jgi:hypothetical protein
MYYKLNHNLYFKLNHNFSTLKCFILSLIFQRSLQVQAADSERFLRSTELPCWTFYSTSCVLSMQCPGTPFRNTVQLGTECILVCLACCKLHKCLREENQTAAAVAVVSVAVMVLTRLLERQGQRMLKREETMTKTVVKEEEEKMEDEEEEEEKMEDEEEEEEEKMEDDDEEEKMEEEEEEEEKMEEEEEEEIQKSSSFCALVIHLLEKKRPASSRDGLNENPLGAVVARQHMSSSIEDENFCISLKTNRSLFCPDQTSSWIWDPLLCWPRRTRRSEGCLDVLLLFRSFEALHE